MTEKKFDINDIQTIYHKDMGIHEVWTFYNGILLKANYRIKSEQEAIDKFKIHMAEAIKEVKILTNDFQAPDTTQILNEYRNKFYRDHLA